MSNLKMVVGLGNPGPKYANNRHNIGFRAVELFGERHNIKFSKTEHKASTGSGWIKGPAENDAGMLDTLTSFFNRPEQKVLLVKPQTYMNNSGESVGALANFYKVDAEDILVVHDDLDLLPAKLRMRPGGGSGGQNGIKSIIRHVGTPDFPRLRIGIGRPPGQMKAATYVLQDFLQKEADLFMPVSETICDWIDYWLFHGVDSAMNKFNSKN